MFVYLKKRGCRKLEKIRLATVFYENERKKLRRNCEEIKKEHTKERVG